MDPLPPIPTPRAQRWREFRIQVLPLIVFVAVVAVVVMLWTKFVQPVGVVGEVEAIRADVTSLQDGLLTELNVDLLQPVKAGQVLGYVRVKSPESLRTELAGLEGDLRITELRVQIDERRRAQDLTQLEMDVMDHQAELEGDRMQLIQASNDFFRVSKVYLERDDVYSAQDYDLAEANYKRLQALVEKRTELVEMIGQQFAELAETKPDIDRVVANALRGERLQMERGSEPVTLRAPIDGRVSMLHRRVGERVLRGEPVLSISAEQASRIVGYVSQPITTLPTTNDSVVITTRHQPRRKGEGQILEVGSAIEPVRPGLLSQDRTRVDTGLIILVSVPRGLEVIPGELVDLVINYREN